MKPRPANPKLGAKKIGKVYKASSEDYLKYVDKVKNFIEELSGEWKTLYLIQYGAVGLTFAFFMHRAHSKFSDNEG